MLAVYKRELASYFRSPIGWVAIAMYALLGGFYFSVYLSSSQTVDMSGELSLITSFFVIIVPLITMRLFSEEKKNGTEVLLYTSTVPLHKIVFGKYFAALSLLGIMLSSTLIHVVLIAIMGGLINATTLGAYISFIFTGALLIAIGIMASAVTENQIIAAVISAAVIIFIQLMQLIATSLEGIFVSIAGALNPLNLSTESINKAGENIASAINWLDPFTRTDPLNQGIFSISPLLYCLSLIVLFLFLTYRILEKRRWSQG
jgi:ABC-2 type transport system permease protein